MRKNPKVRNLVFTALCLAIGLALPQLLHGIPQGGQIFTPMHLPVLLCGLICGWTWGLACGLATPLISSLLFAMPPSPVLPGMMLELAVYGFAAGMLYRYIRLNLGLSLVISMLLGRFAYGALNGLLLLSGNSEYSLSIFITSMFITALPGIILQLIIIPLVVKGLEKANIIEKPHKPKA